MTEAVCVNTMLMSVRAPQSGRMAVVKAASWFVMEGNLLHNAYHPIIIIIIIIIIIL